ncbi:PIN domain-containing protein [Pedobacter changchengzhani]|uniref:PIN domain-containing protein n=1 Tax=Pedobacter changchengzhani TaxID=2529274 RepID=A0A4R5MIN9_9SPHI|nr:PIN domain-containing protein [Pedobacter changchengzhani]TDG35454.1 PIN domain-containing protein [Pedobacter changchengzhani]
MNNILLDSDILIDFLLQRKPFFDDSLNILSECEKGKIKGYLTALAISNTHYIIRKHFSHQLIMENFKKLLTFLDVVITDKNAVLASIDSDFNDFEDALQNFSAENYGTISIIITRNIKDYKKSKLSVLTPEMFLKTL